jgi:hypothetical protein
MWYMTQNIFKGVLLLLGVMIIFSVAQAAFTEQVYLPMIFNFPSPSPSSTATTTPTGTPTATYSITPTGTIYTPTPSRTVTPTITGTPPTATPTRTITPTPTQTLIPGFYIMHIEHTPDFDPLDEWVSIKNATTNSVEMQGWILKNDHTPADVYTFPKFTLRAGYSVKVWTKWGENTTTDLYWGLDYPVWNTGSDCAWLRDADNEYVTNLCYNP